ncbi:MAG: hypothetical protein LAT82_01885 [Nanoarchaeota archaeon]|nr:hypothetical protein [Nanoarchaeota archaeon]
MEIQELHKKFQEIIEKYDFKSSSKAQELTSYIMSKNIHTPLELSQKFNIQVEEASIILEFLKRGIQFKNSTQNY